MFCLLSLIHFLPIIDQACIDDEIEPTQHGNYKVEETEIIHGAVQMEDEGVVLRWSGIAKSDTVTRI